LQETGSFSLVFGYKNVGRPRLRLQMIERRKYDLKQNIHYTLMYSNNDSSHCNENS
jgi:hypothetical protein